MEEFEVFMHDVFVRGASGQIIFEAALTVRVHLCYDMLRVRHHSLAKLLCLLEKHRTEGEPSTTVSVVKLV